MTEWRDDEALGVVAIETEMAETETEICRGKRHGVLASGMAVYCAWQRRVRWSFMKEVHGTLVSAYVGAPGSLKKVECDTLQFAFDGIVGDRHRGFTRAAWDLTDKQPGGTERRNERQWSAVAHEDLQAVSKQLGLPAALRAGDVAVNLSISGVPEFSRLPRGTELTFEGGVVLIVEEYNPPCSRMSQHIADHYHRANEEPLGQMDFIEASKFCRGLVGAVEVPGIVSVGEGVTVKQEVLPKWLRA